MKNLMIRMQQQQSILMGVQRKQVVGEQAESDEESNETMPIHQMNQLSLQDRPNSQITNNHPESNHSNQFLKNKPISKNRTNLHSEKKHMKQLNHKIAQLQKQLAEAKAKAEQCPHCHFQDNYSRQDFITPEDGMCVETVSNRRTSKESIEFQKFDFNLPLLNSPDIEEKTWVFLGIILIAMGSKIIDYDGTLNVFKILKESVDIIRRQVDKSADRLTMDFFLSKQEIEGDKKGMNEVGFDPFMKYEEVSGFTLEGVRVESVEEFDLVFEQKMSFSVKYEALLTIVEYMREHCRVAY